MGDFPLMTESGTFIINGTERVVVTQLVRSPGAYIMEPKDATKQVLTASLMPSRGSWLEFEVETKGYVSVRIDRKRKLPVTVLLKALGMGGPEEILDRFDDSWLVRNTLERDDTPSQGRGAARGVPAPASGRAGQHRERAEPGGRALLRRQALRPLRGGALQGQQEAQARRAAREPHADHRGHRGAAQASHRDLRGGRRGGGVRAGQLRAHPAQARRVRALRQQATEDRWGVGAGGVPDRDVPHGARGARADDDPGRGVHNAPERRQHQARCAAP